jgi:uncharacterized alpha-E superfamily protein
VLSRLADHIYWMSRYIERAENTARLLDVQHQASMLPGVDGERVAGWRALLQLYELEAPYLERHGKVGSERVLQYMVMDTGNPSSIARCLAAARENARVVRVVLATEVWETVNATWLELRTRLRDPGWSREPRRLLDWVKMQSHLFRGVLIGTMLKDEALHFSRIGTFLERADNTARILDVKYVTHRHREAPAQDRAEYYFWASVLRSVSAFELYRRVYRDVITPLRIAELLIHRADAPRSLLACMNEVMTNLELVVRQPQSPSLRAAGRLRASLQYLLVDAAFESRIHDFLTGFLVEVDALGRTISDEFLVPLAAA